MKVLLVRLRLIGDVVFTTPAIRAIRDALPDAHLTYLVEPCGGDDCPRTTRISTRCASCPSARLASRPRRPAPGSRAAPRAVRRGARLSRRPARAVADLGHGRTAAIGYRVSGRAWMYTELVASSARPAAATLGRESVGSAPAPSRPSAAARTRIRRAIASEMAEAADAAASVARRLTAAGIEPGHRLIVIHVSAGNPFRRWPADFFVELGCRSWRGGPGSSYHPDGRPLGGGRLPDRHRGSDASRAGAVAGQDSDGRGILAGRTAEPRHARGALHRRRQRSAARRRNDRTCRSWDSTAHAAEPVGALAARLAA